MSPVTDGREAAGNGPRITIGHAYWRNRDKDLDSEPGQPQSFPATAESGSNLMIRAISVSQLSVLQSTRRLRTPQSVPAGTNGAKVRHCAGGRLRPGVLQ